MQSEIDVMYVVGRGSLYDDIELRYSLRCLDANAKNLGRVFIVGHVPAFVNRKSVLFHECEDTHVSGKHWNMLDKILAGIDRFGIVDEFLFSSDDHFMCKKFDLRKWPRYTRGDIETECEWATKNGKPCGKYQKSMSQTRMLLERNGLPIDKTVWHGNMWIDPLYANEVRALAYGHERECVYGYEPMVLFHAVKKKNHPEIQYARLPKDVKAKKSFDAINLAETVGVFSTYDTAWRNGNLRRYLQERFPQKSRFET